MRYPPSPRHAHGFTLLEAIVALVVFTMGAFALYGWLSTNVITLQRIGKRQVGDEATLSALDLIRRSNPMEAATGERRIGDLTVVWVAKLIEPPKYSVGAGGSPTIYLVGLYDMRVRLLQDGVVQDEFHVRQLGWKQTQAIN